jgi:hypothetical protein
LAGWVDKTLDLAFIRKKLCQGSKVQGFGHLTLGPWIQKLALTLYTLQNLGKEEEESKQEDGEQDWIKHIAAKKLINISSTKKIPIAGLSKDQPRYYVNMLRIPIIINHAFVIDLENMVENLAQTSLD